MKQIAHLNALGASFCTIANFATIKVANITERVKTRLIGGKTMKRTKSNREKSPIRTCADCIHEYACAMWNVGNIHNADASGCANYETVKMSAAYFIGKMDGEKGASDERN